MSTPAYPEWRPIESAPKDGGEVDLWADGKRVTNARFLDGEWKAWMLAYHESIWGYWPIHNEPTHWMPLPGAPALSDQPTRQEDAG